MAACRTAGCWLLAEWPAEADEPTGYWLSTLPADTPITELVRLAKIRWRVGARAAWNQPSPTSTPACPDAAGASRAGGR
jgi:hypothetical protein